MPEFNEINIEIKEINIEIHKLIKKQEMLLYLNIMKFARALTKIKIKQCRIILKEYIEN